jgi:pimeloyl-ACP methyl ester carboxylesterase
MWEPIMPELAKRGYLALAPDLIGHGASDGPAALPALHEYADGVWCALDALEIERASLLGHHSGASIAIIMAAQQPARVNALALWGVPLMTPEREARLGGEGQPDWEHAENWICQRWEGRRAASGAGWTPEIGRRALLELLQAGPDSQWLHNAVARTPVEPYLPKIQQPVLTICGELDSLFHESEEAARMAPNGRFVAMHGASLDVADQDGIAFVDIVGEFLRECTARSSR